MPFARLGFRANESITSYRVHDRGEVTMFPEETHQKIVKQMDDIEAELFGLYRKLERLRLSLQERWRVLPSGEKWTPARHSESELSVFPTPQTGDAVAGKLKEHGR